MSAKLGAIEKKKPETIEFCSKTKCGVDVADQMARLYSVKADTHRWPVAVFYKILDLAGINAFVLYKKTNWWQDFKTRFSLQACYITT